MTALAHADLSGLVRGELATDVVTASGGTCTTCERLSRRPARRRSSGTPCWSARPARSARRGRAADAARRCRRLQAAHPDQAAPAPRRACWCVGRRCCPRRGGGAGRRRPGAAWSVRATDRSSSPQRSATLEAVAGGHRGGGTVAMTEASGRTSMTISTHDLPDRPGRAVLLRLAAGPETNKMLPLGQVGPSGTRVVRGQRPACWRRTPPSTSASRTTTATPSTHRPRCSGRCTREGLAPRKHPHRRRTPHEDPLHDRRGHRRRRADRHRSGRRRCRTRPGCSGPRSGHDQPGQRCSVPTARSSTRTASDFDIVEAAVYAVAGAKPESPVLLLADGTKRAHRVRADRPGLPHAGQGPDRQVLRVGEEGVHKLAGAGRHRHPGDRAALPRRAGRHDHRGQGRARPTAPS